MSYQIVCDDVLAWAAGYEGEPFHAVLCDPPYHLYSPVSKSGSRPKDEVSESKYNRFNNGGFMGKHWDGGSIAFDPATWAALAEHLHPGGFILAFGGSRTYHRLACAVEDAGLIVHPALVWLNGQGFPKATRLDKAIDKMAGIEQDIIGEKRTGALTSKPGWRDVGDYQFNSSANKETVANRYKNGTYPITAPATPLAAAWAGHRYGLQALKPCAEFILCAQKPYSGRPVDSIVATGAGALNIEESRVRLTSHNQDGGAFSYKHSSLHDTQEWLGVPSGGLESCLCFLRNISFALRYNSISDKDLLHNSDGQDGNQQDEIHQYVRIVLFLLFPNGVWCGLDLTQLQDFQCDCLACRRLCDEQLHVVQEAAQDGAPSLADALEHMCSLQSEPSHIPWKCSDHLSSLDDLGLLGSLANLLYGALNNAIIPYSEYPRKFDNLQRPARRGKGSVGGWANYEQKPGLYGTPPGQGRWPPNVTLSHVSPHPCPACDGDGCEACGDGWLEGCRRVGTKRVRSGTAVRENVGVSSKGIYSPGHSDITKDPTDNITYADPDGLETVDDWICVESCPVRALGEMSGERPTGKLEPHHTENHGHWSKQKPWHVERSYGGDTGTAARFYPQSSWEYEIEERLAGVTPFYYVAKASRRERDSGLEGFEYQQGFDKNTSATIRRSDPDTGVIREFEYTPSQRRNHHPCCKPLELVKWLATLLLPPPEYAPRRLLVPFAGSGSEICGALLAGWDEVVGVEMEPEYVEICEARCRFWAGWSERGHDDPKEILKEAAKEAKKQPEPQMELL